MLMSLLASGGALLLASSAFMAYDFFAYRQALVKAVSTLSEIVSVNAASAVVFNDSASATKTLASLKVRPSAISARIYTPQGKLFAEWERSPGVSTASPSLPMETRETHQFHDGSLMLFHPMVLDNSPIGTVSIESNLTDLWARLKRYVLIAAGVLVISLLVASSISLQVGRKISAPILHLVDVAKAVSEKKDYSVRAEGGGEDELGILIRTFNEMLTKIQEDGKALRESEARPAPMWSIV